MSAPAGPLPGRPSDSADQLGRKVLRDWRELVWQDLKDDPPSLNREKEVEEPELSRYLKWLVDTPGQKSMRDFAGKVVLIVNVASKCGFTPQYKGLEELFKKYHGQGLEVLGFPCNQFGAQEPGDESEIQGFCELNFGVTFPLMENIKVNGKEADPLYVFLKERAPGDMTSAIKWNFTKFLVSRDGSNITRHASAVTPESLEKPIEALLGEERP